MEQYLTPQNCRAVTIERYFGEEDAVPCDTCDDCRASAASLLQGVVGLLPENGLRISEWLWHYPLIEHNLKMKELTLLRDAGEILLKGDQIFTAKSD